MKGLEGKVAIVTASSKGMGKAIAQKLAQEGCNVTIASRSRENLIKAFEDISKVAKGEVIWVEADLRKEEDIRKIVEETVKKWGTVDILVSNTGGPKPGGMLEVKGEDWKEAIDLVLMSAIRLTYGVVEYMIRKNWGRIVYITSMSVKEPIDGLILSNVTRAGVNAFAKTISRELAKYNILVNVICPGNIYTDRAIQLIKNISETTGKNFEDVKKEIEKGIPLGRYGDPMEIANVVAFLVSEEASYLTGSTIQVDGGLIKCII